LKTSSSAATPAPALEPVIATTSLAKAHTVVARQAIDSSDPAAPVR
jgi:hypothetical protein